MYHITSHEYVPYPSNFEKASEIPSFCTQMAKILEQQPLFKGSGSIIKKSKVISLETWDDARICDIFNSNAKRILGTEQAWRIRDFGCGNLQLFDSMSHRIPQGLTLWLYDRVSMCPLETLQNSYNQIFESMTTGWTASSIEDNLDIMFKEDTKEFALFIKNKTLVEEDTLIRFIASRFSMEDDVRCNAEWLTHSEYCYNGKIYLWIKKSAFKEVIDRFGFKLS